MMPEKIGWNTTPDWVSPFPGKVAFASGGMERLGEYRLQPGERELLGANAARKRISEFTLARGLAREALARLDPALAETPLPRTGVRMPRWPEGYVGAITHHRGIAAAAAARAADFRGVGVDLEQVRSPSPALLQRILRPEERRWVEGLAEEERALRFTLAFSAKESLYKALNPRTGIFLGFQDAAVEISGSDIQSVENQAGEFPASGDAGKTRGSFRREFRWKLHAPCGAEFPAGFVGEGGYALDGSFVLTGVWIGPEENPGR